MIFERIFDAYNMYWDPGAMWNKFYLESVRNSWQITLEHLGYVTLLDVMRNCGFGDITQECFTYGWHDARDSEINMKIEQIDDTANFMITFDCEPILDYFEEESGE